MIRIIHVAARRFTAVIAVVVLAVAGVVLTSPAASAAVQPAVTGASIAAMSGNSCGLPTEANWPGYYDGSYRYCWVCEGVAGWLNYNSWFTYYYCTYNPSTGLTDLHHDD